jgi:uncharacterized protein YndB with AHSA1/START domain
MKKIVNNKSGRLISREGRDHLAGSTFTYTTYISTTPNLLWNALTKGELTQRYFFGRTIQSEWKIGSTVYYYREDEQLDVHGDLLKYDPDHLISFTWKVEGDTTERVDPTCVSFLIEQMEDTVKLTLKHENLLECDFVKDDKTFAGVNNGWPAILSNLKSYLETGSTLPAVKA